MRRAAKVTLDTNVYVSALQFGSMRLLHMAIDGDIEIAVSEPILSEVIRVLRDKFQWDGYRLQDARQQILRLARLVAPRESLAVVKEDEPDNRILECAVAAGSQYVLTNGRPGPATARKLHRHLDHPAGGLSETGTGAVRPGEHSAGTF